MGSTFPYDFPLGHLDREKRFPIAIHLADATLLGLSWRHEERQRSGERASPHHRQTGRRLAAR